MHSMEELERQRRELAEQYAAMQQKFLTADMQREALSRQHDARAVELRATQDDVCPQVDCVWGGGCFVASDCEPYVGVCMHH